MRPSIDVCCRATPRGTGTPSVSSLVPNAITRSTHRSTVPVEDDSPARRRADHVPAAILDANGVRCAANHSSIPGSRTGLVVGFGIPDASLKQQAQAYDN